MTDSAEGARQGDLQASLVFALSILASLRRSVLPPPAAPAEEMRGPTEAAVAEATAVSVMDDISFIGSVRGAMASFDRLKADPELAEMEVVLAKTQVLWPHASPPSREVEVACAERGLRLVCGSMAVLGAMVGAYAIQSPLFSMRPSPNTLVSSMRLAILLCRSSWFLLCFVCVRPLASFI